MPAPKYEVIAQYIRDQIAAEQLSYGDQIPSGRDLAERFGCVRATVVHAMDILRNEGLIVSRQGSGFFVTDAPLGRPAGGRRAGTTRLTGALTFQRVGDPERVPAPERVAEALGVAAGSPVLRRARLMQQADGTATSHVVAFFPPDIADAAPLLSRTAPLPGGTTRHITATTGRSPARGVDVLTVRLATVEEARLLGVKRPAAVQVVLHTSYDADGRALVCEEGVTPAPLAEHVDEYPMSG